MGLITGASGFVGSRLAARLLQDGWTIHVVCRAESRTARLEEIGAVIHVFNGSTQHLVDVVGKALPDVVFHLASYFTSDHSTGDIEPLVRSNVLFGTQLLEAMARARVTRLVNAGTSWQHFQDKDYSPVCLYAATKQAFEALVQFFVEAHGLNAVTLDLFDTYGPGDTRKKLFRLLIDAASREEELAMTSGRQLLNLVHVDDVAEAFAKASEMLMDEPSEGHTRYAVAARESIPLRSVVQLFNELSPKKVRVRWDAREHRTREVMRPWSRGNILPGWQARIPLALGLSELLLDQFREGESP